MRLSGASLRWRNLLVRSIRCATERKRAEEPLRQYAEHL